MEYITKEEFIKRLKENKQDFDSLDEKMDYRLPVLQYYITNYSDITMVNNGKQLNTKDMTITIADRDLSYQLVNLAFEGLVKRVGEFELLNTFE